MTNLKEFKELIERYNSITIEEIIEVNKILYDDLNSGYGKFDANTIANILTGYGSIHTCTLCSTTVICSDCTWSNTKATHCNDFRGSSDTYEAIRDTITPDELLTAFKARAAYMQEQLNLLEL